MYIKPVRICKCSRCKPIRCKIAKNNWRSISGLPCQIARKRHYANSDASKCACGRWSSLISEKRHRADLGRLQELHENQTFRTIKRDNKQTWAKVKSSANAMFVVNCALPPREVIEKEVCRSDRKDPGTGPTPGVMNGCSKEHYDTDRNCAHQTYTVVIHKRTWMRFMHVFNLWSLSWSLDDVLLSNAERINHFDCSVRSLARNAKNEQKLLWLADNFSRNADHHKRTQNCEHFHLLDKEGEQKRKKKKKKKRKKKRKNNKCVRWCLPDSPTQWTDNEQRC